MVMDANQGGDPATLIIFAASERQAMDWSLVLTSQGISSSLIRSEGEGITWGLSVSREEHSAALEAIRLYQLENRGWNWRQKIPRTELVFHWGTLLWCAALVFLFLLEEIRGVPLRQLGMVDSSAIHNGQWWRWFTAVWLHASPEHLASNVSIGFVLLGLAMGSLGPGWGILGSFLAGTVGNILCTLILAAPHRSLGASGMIMGMLGLMSAQQTFDPQSGSRIRSGLAAGACLFILLGLSPESNVLAHFGGFVAGVGLGMIYRWTPHSYREGNTSNLVAIALFLVITAFTWAKVWM